MHEKFIDSYASFSNVKASNLHMGQQTLDHVCLH